MREILLIVTCTPAILICFYMIYEDVTEKYLDDKDKQRKAPRERNDTSQLVDDNATLICDWAPPPIIYENEEISNG